MTPRQANPELLIRVACPADRDRFLAWAAEVEPLFGPMVGVPAFEDALGAALEAGEGRIALGPDGLPLGGILIGSSTRHVGWLVVGGAGRGRGAGRALLAAALESMGPGPVEVETFAEEVPEGRPARVLYERAGFVPTGRRGATPAGIPTEVLLRP